MDLSSVRASFKVVGTYYAPEKLQDPVGEPFEFFYHIIDKALVAASGFELGQYSRTRVWHAADKVHKLKLAAWINYNVPVAFIAGCNDDYKVAFVEGEYMRHSAVNVSENIHRHDEAVHAKSTQGRLWM